MEKCRVIPNGINLTRFSHVPEVSMEPHPLAVGAIIRVVPIKDIKTMTQTVSYTHLYVYKRQTFMC